MTQVKRKDQWTAEDDHKLATTVLEIVKNGGTQIHAFEVAAEKLSRTKQACGFRWNKTLRHTYGQDLNHAKQKYQHPMHTHLKQAMSSYEELLEAHDRLQKEHAQLKTFVQQIQRVCLESPFISQKN